MCKEKMGIPKLVVAALRGGSGKTIISMGIIAALRNQSSAIAPFKKGPDYIDAGWLALAANRPCYNLDSFLIDATDIIDSFVTHTRPEDIAVIEGNRGLFDGIDLEGKTSTAELAKLLKAPVLLCLDCTKSTRTMAAVVLGCLRFDPSVNINGVVLNRVANPRHESNLRKNIEHHCGVPVIGAIPKLKKELFPERHMGLVPTAEHTWAKDALDAVKTMALDYLDIGAIQDIAQKAAESDINIPKKSRPLSSLNSNSISLNGGLKPKIGIIKDSAFQFYYPENLDALEKAGAETVFISPLSQRELPPLDALYIGGGFPETHAKQLSENVLFRNRIKSLADNGLPVYAECGGLMYLGNTLVLEGRIYPMCGVFPIEFGFTKRPQGHGYTVVQVERENPYFPIGMEIKGHEFHYSFLKDWRGKEDHLAFAMTRGTGLFNKKDGICYKNVLATYTHIHALGTPTWAYAMVRNALQYKKGQP
jgi:cobyrinic acid a,c-diamide synthase